MTKAEFGSLDRLIACIPLECWRVLLTYPPDGMTWRDVDQPEHVHPSALARLVEMRFVRVGRVGAGHMAEAGQLLVEHAVRRWWAMCPTGRLVVSACATSHVAPPPTLPRSAFLDTCLTGLVQEVGSNLFGCTGMGARLACVSGLS
jgi:hypothetical protein